MDKSFLVDVKDFLRPWKYRVKNLYVARCISSQANVERHVSNVDLELSDVKKSINIFLGNLCGSQSDFLYKYSSSCMRPTLYASTYACMLYELLGNSSHLSEDIKRSWCNYFDSFQDKRDGLFYDPVTNNDIYADTDWWGARHLALHIILAYGAMGFEPKYRFCFLDEYCEPGKINDWLSNYPWDSNEIGKTDIDNKIMNIGCLIQYERDRTGSDELKKTLLELKLFLRSKINKSTGIWGGSELGQPGDRSRMVQFAYHLLPIFFYDEEYDFNLESIADIVLKTQTGFGGYGVNPNSSACEDIDSLDLLIAISKKCTPATQEKIKDSIKKAYFWILRNQVADGGFVFRLFEPFRYGHLETSSGRNIGALFPTWFRFLSLIHAHNHLQTKQIPHVKRPGYYFFGSDSC